MINISIKKMGKTIKEGLYGHLENAIGGDASNIGSLNIGDDKRIYNVFIDAINIVEKNGDKTIPRKTNSQWEHFLYQLMELLPYGCDRRTQKQQFIDCIMKGYDRPIITFIYGAEDECHKELTRQIQDKILRICPQFKDDDCLNEEYLVKWPDSKTAKNVESRFKSLLSNFGLKLECEQNDEERVITAIVKHPAKTMCFRHVISNWHSTDKILVEKAVMFWNTICDKIIGKRLFVFFCFTYNRPGILPFWSKIHSVKRFVEKFEPSFEKYRSIHGYVFHKLEPVRSDDLGVEEYVDAFKEELQEIQVNTNNLKMFLNTIYSKKKAFPMRTLGLLIAAYIKYEHEKKSDNNAVNNRS